jgi:polyhydroxyalkanoate synthesis regulator phasin
MEGMISIVVAAVSGLAAIATVIINVKASNKEMTAKLEQSLAVMETKLDNVVSEVREHNEFARRMPVLEEQVKGHERRIEALENKERRCVT